MADLRISFIFNPFQTMSALSPELTKLIIESGEISTVKKENFIAHSYNGLEIIYREKDMYVNAGNLCSTQHKDFKMLMRTKYWKEEIIPAYESDILSQITNTENPDQHPNTTDFKLFYYLDPGYQKFQGYYIHPRLVHEVAHWCSITYSITVSKYMDSINEELIRKNITFEQKLKEQEEYVKQLQTTIDRHDEGKITIEGEIEIIPFRPGNIYTIKANQFPTIEKKPTHRYISTFNSQSILTNIKYYSNLDLIEGVEFIDKSFSVFKGEIDRLVEVVQNFKNNVPIITTNKLKELNERDLAEAKKYNHPNTKNGLEFEIYCSDKYNIPRYCYSNPESLGMKHNDTGLDLLDIHNKITGQCKCYNNILARNALNTFFRWVDYIDEHYEGWQHKLFLLKTTKIPKALIPEIEKRDIQIIHEDYETEQMKIVNEEHNKLNERIKTLIDENVKSKDNVVYYITSEKLTKLSKQQQINIQLLTHELRSRGYESKSYENKRSWVKEPESVKNELSNIKQRLESIIKHKSYYDVISREDLDDLCKELHISIRNVDMMNALYEMNFEYKRRNMLQWARINKTLLVQYHDFITNHLKDFIHVSADNGYEYIMLDDVKEYCKQNGIPFARDETIEYITNELHFVNHTRCYTKENYGKRMWTKPTGEKLTDLDEEQSELVIKLKEEIVSMIEPYELLDALSAESIEKLCKNNNVLTHSTVFQKAMNELGFKRLTTRSKTYTYIRDNEEKIKRLDEFLHNELQTLIKIEPGKFKYISTPEIKEYCDEHNITFNSHRISDYIKKELNFVNEPHSEIMKKTKAARIWTSHELN